ncbi:MAG: hypothetical protein J6W35_08015 [Eubacterium sp.]|nr:hypothetical protein [Eubacterium sp.]
MKMCKNCRKEYGWSRYDEYCCKECWEANYWEKALDSKAIIIGGHCYHAYGGKFDKSKKIKIRMNDGTLIETYELFDGGKIPRKFHMKDNAKFVKW